ncbi:MAG: KDO2-lipid IV(A) lauroyltransferase [Planctomycetota bacterium]
MEQTEEQLEPGQPTTLSRSSKSIEDVLPDRIRVFGKRNGLKAHIEYVAMRVTVQSLARLPYKLRGRIIGSLAWIASRVMKKRVGHAREFLKQAYGPELDHARRDELVRRAFSNLCHVIIDDVARQQRFDPKTLLNRVTIEGDPEAVAAFRKGGPGVIMNLHMGDWEMLAQVVASCGYGPFYAVGKPTKNRPVSTWIQRQREKGGVFMIARNGAVESAQRAISKGGSLGLVLDHRATSRPVLAPFFGRLALSERSASIMLKRFRIPAYLLVCLRTDEPYRYRVVLETVITPAESRRMKPLEFLTLLNSHFERMILRWPDQYFWLHDRYRAAEKTQVREAEGNVKRVRVKKPPTPEANTG